MPTLFEKFTEIPEKQKELALFTICFLSLLTDYLTPGKQLSLEVLSFVSGATPIFAEMIRKTDA